MTDFPPWVPIPSHRTGVGDGSANSMLIPEQFGPIAEWINKHIRSWHGPYGYGDWPLYDYYVDDSWAATGFPEGTIINTYTGTKIYSTIQGAVNAWSTSAADKTMFIAPGHYDEDVVVNATSTQHIHMEGGSAARTFIDGSITFNGQFNNNLSVEWRPPSVIRNLKVSAVAGGSAGDLFLGQTTVHTPNTIEGLSFENCHFEGQLKGLYHATSMATLVLRCSFSNCTFGGADDNGGVLILEETSFDRCAFEGPFDLHYGYGGTASSIGEASNSLEPCVFTETLFRQGLIIGDVYAGTFTDCTFQSLTGVDHAMWISGGSDGPGTLYGPNVGECILSGCHFVYYRGANAEFSFIKLGSNQSIGYTSWENFTVTDCTVDVPNAPYAGTNPIHIIWSIGELANGDVPKIVFAHNALIEDSDGNRLEDLTTTPASTTVKGTFRDSVFGPNEPPNCVYDVKGPNNVFYPDSAIPYYSASVGGKHIVYMDGVDTTVVYWKAFACRFDGVTKWVAAGSLGGVAMPGFAPPVYYVIEVTSAGVVQGTSLGLAANKYNACTAGCIPLAVVEANGVLGVGTTFKIDHGRATPLDLDTGLTAGGSAPAPNDAQYVVLAADGDLTVERVFAPGVGLTATDDGAGGDYHLIHATDATAIPNAHHNAVTIGADGEHSLATQVLSGVDAAAAQKGHIQLAGQLGGSAASPTVKGITETSGPTALTVGTITDGQFLKRVAGTLVSAAVSGDVATDTIWAAAGDLVVGTGVDTAGILSKGTDGKVLTMVAGAVAWAAPAAGGGDVATDAIWDAAGDLAVGTGANTAAKLALTVPGGANLLNVLGVVNGETTPTWKALFDTTHPENLGTAAEGSGTIAALRNHVHTLPKLDDLAAPDANTDLDASTTAHGLVVAATAPAAGLYNYVGITNAETAYTNKALFDATVPGTIAESAAAAAGTAAVAARRDHTHGAPATYAPTAHNVFSASHGDTTGAANPVDGDMIIGNATPKWSKLAISIPGGAGLLNVMGIVTGELRSSWKALFDATAPAAIGTAAAGTATTAAHRDHVHAADSDDVTYAPTTAADWDGAADPGDVEQALDQLAERVRNASVWVPASAMWPSTSTGAAWPARREYTTNDVDVFYVAFDSGAVVNDEKAQFSVVLPVWDQGTVTLTYHWTTVAAAGTTVCWSADAVSIANDGALDSAWGSAVTATDTVLAAGDVHIITSGAITVSGAGAGEFVNFRIMRDTSEDDCASDADLLGVVINYNKRDA